MRAIVFDRPGDEEVLRLVDVPSPTLADSDVRLRVCATAVNRADLLQRRGFYPAPAGASPILGLECAGVISEVGPAVRHLRVGMRAMALLAGGGYAEEAISDAGSVLPIPACLSDEEAAGFMETFLTAYLNIFLLGEARAGQTVLVHGGGSGVGTSAVSLCKEAGIRTIVTAGGADKIAQCLRHGADVAINYKDGDFAPKVLVATENTGAHVVLDAIGASYLAQNLSCVATDGRLIVIGLMGGSKAEVDLALVLRKRLTVTGSTLRSRSIADKAEMVRSFQQRFGAALTEGRLRPVVHAVLPLVEAATAHRLVQASSHFGKVVLRVATAKKSQVRVRGPRQESHRHRRHR